MIDLGEGHKYVPLTMDRLGQDGTALERRRVYITTENGPTDPFLRGH